MVDTIRGSFKKEASDIANINKVKLINIVISLDHPKNESLGILNIVYYMDKSEMRAKFVPESGTIPSENYSETFNFKKMFQW